MSCSHIYGSDRSRKLSCRHFRGFMLLKDLKKLKGRERVTPDKAFFVLYPAWRQLESDGGSNQIASLARANKTDHHHQPTDPPLPTWAPSRRAPPRRHG